MNSPIGLKNKEWDLSISKYDEIDDFPLMRTPGPVLMILAGYLLFVLKIGPAYMRKREAYKLKTVLVLYNGIQVVLSFYLMVKFLITTFRLGLIPKTCYLDQAEQRSEILNGIWWYLAAKITELLDTIFFVFRKKDNQVSFLHLYHHTIMAIGTWCTLKYFPSHLVIFIGFLNSLVHVFMYTYYTLAVFGDRFAKYLTWKKYMTAVQLIQFVMIVIQYVTSVRTSDCPPSKGVSTLITANTFFIMLLFLNFYRKSYHGKSRKDNKKTSTSPVTNNSTNTNLPVIEKKSE